MSPVVTVTLETARALQVGESLAANVPTLVANGILPAHVGAALTEHAAQLTSAATVATYTTHDEQMEAGHA